MLRTRRNPTWIWVAALLLLALLTKSGLVLIVALLVGLITLMVLLWQRYGLERVEYQRHFDRSRCFAGDQVELSVSITNRKLLPLASLLVEESVPEQLEITSRRLQFHSKGRQTLRLLFSLSWYQRVTRRYTVTANRRGCYRVGPATLRSGDPFGWAEESTTVEPSDLLVVYPRILPLEEVGIPSRRPFGDLSSRDRLFEDPIRFAGVREYQPGDPLNRIHWGATAAAGRLQVRQLDPSASMGLAIFLNTWSFTYFWEGDEPSSLEAGVSLAASVANWACDNGVPAGLYANGMVYEWGLSLRMPPSRGADVLSQVLEGLARLRTGSPQPIWELLNAEMANLPYGTSVVLISRQVNEELAAALMRLRRSGRPVTLILTGGQAEAETLPALPGVRLYIVEGEEGLHAAVLAP